jgi:hypothetical protein
MVVSERAERCSSSRFTRKGGSQRDCELRATNRVATLVDIMPPLDVLRRNVGSRIVNVGITASCGRRKCIA